MLLKCTADGRRIKVNGSPVSQGNVARGMKMTMSTTSTMSSRVHRKVMRAPHKRAHPGKIPHAGKIPHPGKIPHAGKLAHMPGKLTHLAKYYKTHYPHTAHSLRPPELCENSNDSGLGPDHDQRHAINRLTDPVEEWDALSKRQRLSETAVKVECDNAIDAYAYPAPAAAPPPPVEPPPPPAELLRAGCSLSSPSLPENPGKRFHEPAYRPCGKLGSSGKLANKYAGGGKLGTSGKLAGGKLAGKLGGKYGGKLAQALARRRALAMTQSGPPGLAAPLMCRSRDGTVELQILCQPETQHRARYQTEGSRGAVKDNSGNGFPIVKLVGYDKPAVLQVYIGTDCGRVAPHMFYQACRVSGKNSTPCKERKEDGTVVIEIDLEPAKNWQVTCDCVGILKERNVDVEHRFGEALSSGASGAHVSRGKKKSTRCRMVFRTEIVNAEGHTETLQVCSTQIICTQPPGVPEVCRKSLVSSPATGGLELYLLGKNFLKETRVVFCHRQDGCLVWEGEVAPDKEFLQQTHLVCCVPPYLRTDIKETVSVQLFVRSGGKASEPHNFYYTPPAMETGPQHCTRHHTQGSGEEARPVLLWGGSSMMPPPALPVRRPSLILPDPHSPLGLKSELADESSQSSLVDHTDTSCGPDGPDKSSQPLTTEDLKVVDLRLKSETITSERQQQVSFGGYPDAIKLSPGQQTSEPQSPLATFTQQLQAIQNQVQTDKMVETVTAAIFNSADQGGQMYADQPMMGMDSMQRLIASKQPMNMEQDMKVLNSELMITEATMQGSVLQSPINAANEQTMMYNPFEKMQNETNRQVGSHFNHFRAITKMEMETSRMEQRLAQQSAQMEALVEDAMKATAAMLPSDAAKLDELVNSRVEDHLSGASSSSSATSHASDVLLSPNTAPGPLVQSPVLPQMPSSAMTPDVILNPQVSPSMLCDGGQRMVMPPPPPTEEELMMMSDSVQMPGSVKTPPAAVKSMILNAAAEILTSDSTMNALVTSAINTANILTGTESVGGGGGMQIMQTNDNSQPPAEPSNGEAPLSAMSQAVSQAVTQAVSQAVTQAVSQAVSQEMTAPVQGLTDMSDSDLLSYINPSTFDQV